MSFVRLALWLLRRERASGEWRVLLLALIVGVGSVSTTGFLGDRLQRAMAEQGAGFLGADLLLTSPRPLAGVPPHALESASAMEFPSMVSRGDAFQLATIRAVDARYPLRGQVQIAERAFIAGHARPAQPPAGSIYVAQALLPLLKADVGDEVRIGDATFRIGGVVTEEPGQLGGVFGLAPRVFLRLDEVARTGVLQPGSRVSHLYQYAGDPVEVARFADAVRPTLDSTQRLVGARDGVETLRDAFSRADRYIQLTGLMSLLLSIAAIANAAHRHARRRYDQAALLRCLGATAAQLRTLYAAQLLVLGLLGSLLGVALGALAQQALGALLLPDMLARLPTLGWTPVAVAVGSGLLALAAASLPALLRLARVPPLRVLRRELPPLPLLAWAVAGLSGSALLALIVWYARDFRLVAIFIGALAALAAVLMLLSRLALAAGALLRRMAHGPIRFGLTQLVRHRFDSSLQLGAFTLALFLVGLLALVRSELIAGWRQQLPPDAPNYFLVNIAPQQQAAVAGYLAQHRLSASALYPIVRGRLVSRNGVAITRTLAPQARSHNTLRRELNLTWTASLPPNNELLAGRWHGSRQGNEISVESTMAEDLGLKLGDSLEFRIGDELRSARITSIRRVQWDSLQPNFFVIFAPGPLASLPMSMIASVYIPPSSSDALPGFVRAFPGVTVLALDKLIANLEAVFAQIISALQLLLGFLLAAGIAVVLASLLAGLDAREQEAVLLRTLGARRAYLARALWSEFLALGLLAGLLAALCAETAMALIAHRLFDLPVRLHLWLWLVLPLAGALLVGVSGWLTTRHIARVPPLQSLRTLG